MEGGEGVSDFLNRMKDYLKEEYPIYEETLNQPVFRGLRVNPLKISDEKLLSYKLAELSPSSFARHGYYILDDAKLGNTWQHLSGCFYMQEPSASSAVSVLDPQPTDWVLDLCAAPGGKSSQIAALLGDSGFLLSNEIDHARAMVLMSNLERMGVSENMVTNASPEVLCPKVAGWFDRVLVDAPCSGEGMFKKNSKAIEDWSLEHVVACGNRQQKILDSAYLALKQGGVLVYSTCTYAMEENEGVIAHFLQSHPDMELVDCGVTFGRGGYSLAGVDGNLVRRIFPMDKGEGHFIAKMVKHKEADEAKLKMQKAYKLDKLTQAFIDEQLVECPYIFYEQAGKVYAKKTAFIQLEGIKILRQGLLCGEIVKNRFEPHHHFYLATSNSGLLQHVIELDEQQVSTYLEGNVLMISGYKGYHAVCKDGIILGFVKGDGNCLKNKYPKGLRVR